MTLPYRYGWLFGTPNSNLTSDLQKTIRTDLQYGSFASIFEFLYSN